MWTPQFTIFVTVLVMAIPRDSNAADIETLPTGNTAGRQNATQCLKDLEVFDMELAEGGHIVFLPGVAAEPYDYKELVGTPRQKIRALHSAAYVYANEGDEQSCQLVLVSMRKIYEEDLNPVGAEANSLSLRTAERRAHHAKAIPVTEMTRLMRAEIVIGAEIRNLKDEKLGEIEDLVIDPVTRRIVYVLASRGGFLGFGEKRLAIRWSDLLATEDHEMYVLDVPGAVLDDAPTVDSSNFSETAGESWRRQMDQFWDSKFQR